MCKNVREGAAVLQPRRLYFPHDWLVGPLLPVPPSSVLFSSLSLCLLYVVDQTITQVVAAVEALPLNAHPMAVLFHISFLHLYHCHLICIPNTSYQVVAAVEALPLNAHPMAVLMTGLSALSSLHPEANPALAGQDIYKSREVREKQIVRILGKVRRKRKLHSQLSQQGRKGRKRKGLASLLILSPP
jgi:hypothetical protein